MAETEQETAAVELDPATAALAERGFGIVDSLPANHRLRAEALVGAGKDEDPHGHVSRELIADTKDRLEREAAAAKEADEAAARASSQLGRMKVDDLRKIATDESIEIPADADKPAIVDTITAARAARNEG